MWLFLKHILNTTFIVICVCVKSNEWFEGKLVNAQTMWMEFEEVFVWRMTKFTHHNINI